MQRYKTTFSDGRLIQGRIRWRGEVPPVTPVGHETVQQMRKRILDILDALLAVLLKHAQQRFPKVTEDTLVDVLGKKANGEFAIISDTLEQAGEHLQGGHLNKALMYYLHTLELVLAAKCYFEARPEEAFK